MSSIISKITSKFDLIKRGEFSLFYRGVVKHIYSQSEFYGFKRNLDVPLNVEKSKLNLIIRLFEENDKKYFITEHDSDRMVNANLPTCYVAVNEKNIPCYRQWVLTSEQNTTINNFFDKNSFPVLNSNEVLIEGVLTLPKYRRLKIMTQAIDDILKLYKENEIKYALGFVKCDNIPSIKGFIKAGFIPYVIRKERYFLLKKTIVFEDISDQAMSDYNLKIS